MAISSARKRPGRPRVDATPVNVRLPPEMATKLDLWISVSGEPELTRPEAVRRILAETFHTDRRMLERAQKHKPRL